MDRNLIVILAVAVLLAISVFVSSRNARNRIRDAELVGDMLARELKRVEHRVEVLERWASTVDTWREQRDREVPLP